MHILYVCQEKSFINNWIRTTVGNYDTTEKNIKLE